MRRGTRIRRIRWGIYFLNTRTNAGTINATNPDPSVITVPISA
ncbi:hypothetical protein BIFBIF_01810 [Bifidobacterium bifidum ATCC 29521 = JCM 1255 = DSM 20456]|nr:hypothetical protein BIFBIF_01810 [Bifidobacterium bifidum ATCC 29521 = JCM 1255 = DSM 20456]